VDTRYESVFGRIKDSMRKAHKDRPYTSLESYMASLNGKVYESTLEFHQLQNQGYAEALRSAKPKVASVIGKVTSGKRDRDPNNDDSDTRKKPSESKGSGRKELCAGCRHQHPGGFDACNYVRLHHPDANTNRSIPFAESGIGKIY
jgi:hypothetical protein